VRGENSTEGGKGVCGFLQATGEMEGELIREEEEQFLLKVRGAPEKKKKKKTPLEREKIDLQQHGGEERGVRPEDLIFVWRAEKKEGGRPCGKGIKVPRRPPG